MNESRAAELTARLWLPYLTIGILAAVLYEGVSDKIARDVIYLVIGLVGVAGIVLGVRLNRPTLSAPWYVMAAGQLLWVAGDAIYTWYEDVLDSAPFPSLADAFYLAAYPVLAGGVYLLIRGRRPHRDLPGLFDAATVTVGLGLLSWAVLARPTLAASEDSFLAGAVGVAYPIGDILLVAALTRVLTSPGGRSWSLRLLLAAVGLLVVADTLYLLFGLFTSGASYTIDPLWMTSYICWGAAALHPSMAPLSRPTPEVDTRFSRRRLAAMTAAALIAPGTLVVEQIADLHLDVTAVTLASVLLTLLVVGRMRLGIRQIARAHSELERLQEVLAFQAAHDPLTDLPNRAQLMRQLVGVLSRTRRRGDIVAVLFIDLDGFKAVNDSKGHRAGDLVLRAVAGRLREELRAGDVAARLGGDEFVVVLEGVDDEAAAVDVGGRLVDRISEPIEILDGVVVGVGASIGISFDLDATAEPETLLNEADVAVYRAKANGRGRVEVFNPALAEELHLMGDTEAAITRALARDEFVVHYQPIVEIRTDRLVGFEALVRWERPGVGVVLPGEFIPVAERSDLICEIDAWVLRAALTQLAGWNELRGDRDLRMSVNVSGRHLNTAHVVDDVAAALRGAGVAAGQLVLEITETVAVADDLAIDNLHRLTRLGIELSLDDFGTGYSSLAQLSRLPVTQVKIDRSYLDVTAPASRELLRAMVNAAHALGSTVVGEGVEHPEQLDMLTEVGADYAQGYLLGRPEPAATGSAELFVRR